MTGERGPEDHRSGGQHAWTEMIMGLPISIHLRASEITSAARDSVLQAFALLREADQRFSPYRADSMLSRLARGEIDMTEVDDDFRVVLNLAETARLHTDGAFDIRGAGRLDPSGIVKGWAAERAGELLPANSYLNAGGDITTTSDDGPWRVGIEHPADPTGLIAVLAIRNGGVATSGRLHRGDHIFDPATGLAATGILQVTVVGKSLTWADIWATALVARGQRVLDPEDPLIGRLVAEGHQAQVISEDGKVWGTAGLSTYFDPDSPAPRVRLLG